MADTIGVSEYARCKGTVLETVYRNLRAGRIKGAIKKDGVWAIPKTALTEASK